MNEMTDNPWVERFHPLLGQAEIKQLAMLRPTPLIGLQALPKESASSQLHQALETAFYPNSQCVEVLQRWLGVAYAHSQANYSGHNHYYGCLHDEDIEFRRGTVPMCLTGLAGIGKSSLIKAAIRVMPPMMRITSKNGMCVPVESYRTLKMAVSTNPNDLLRNFSNSTGSGEELKRKCRRFAFRNGIAFVIADEFQFTTLSSGASTQITKLLLSLDTLGIPFVFAANFSMLHILNKRNHQERQRLTADITELIPDEPDSTDWKETLELLKEVAPEIFVFNPIEDACMIHTLCAGIKRALVRLLDIAYAAIHYSGVVGMDELLKAYRSADYASYRADFAILQKQTNEAHRKRTDLWNPFTSIDQSDENKRQSLEQRQSQVATASMLAAMTTKERAEHMKSNQLQPEKTDRSVNPCYKKNPLTADELTQTSMWFRESLKGS